MAQWFKLPFVFWGATHCLNVGDCGNLCLNAWDCQNRRFFTALSDLPDVWKCAHRPLDRLQVTLGAFSHVVVCRPLSLQGRSKFGARPLNVSGHSSLSEMFHLKMCSPTLGICWSLGTLGAFSMFSAPDLSAASLDFRGRLVDLSRCYSTMEMFRAFESVLADLGTV